MGQEYPSEQNKWKNKLNQVVQGYILKKGPYYNHGWWNSAKQINRNVVLENNNKKPKLYY